MTQLEIQREATDRRQAKLFARLAPLFGGRLRSLVLTHNRRRILSVRSDRKGRGGLVLRLDGCFVDAEAETLAEVASWALARGGPRKPLHRARSHFERHRGASDPNAEAPTDRHRAAEQTRGHCLDLATLYAHLNRRYFDDQVDAPVTWGRPLHRRPRTRKRPRKQIVRLGSYDAQHHLIRIHRVLDRPEIPRIVVESVLHHEMIHAILPPIQTPTQRRYHTPHFRQLENRYRHQPEADGWIRDHLDWLLKNRYRQT